MNRVGYYYCSVNVINLGLSQSDHIKQFTLYVKSKKQINSNSAIMNIFGPAKFVRYNRKLVITKFLTYNLVSLYLTTKSLLLTHRCTQGGGGAGGGRGGGRAPPVPPLKKIVL
jgi:hypothetical protein